MHVRRYALGLSLTLGLLACHTAGPGSPDLPGDPPPTLDAAPTTDPWQDCPAPGRSWSFVNLVFEGGGVKGIAYAGVLEVLDRQQILPAVRRVAGTSAGSITAAVLALGYQPAEIRQLLLDLDFRRFEDGSELGGVARLVEHYGWFKGDFFLEWMRDRVKEKTGNPDTTFGELQAAGKYLDLSIVSTDLTKRASRVFSAATTPDVPVALAVRLSISIPLFFEAVPFDDGLFVDGGVLWNYPIQIYDQGETIERGTLGLFLSQPGGEQRRPIGHLRQYVKALFETLLSAQVQDFLETQPDVERSVIVDSLGVRATDFALTDEQKEALIASGIRGTCEYLEKLRAE
jgi:NTE family protein